MASRLRHVDLRTIVTRPFERRDVAGRNRPANRLEDEEQLAQSRAPDRSGEVGGDRHARIAPRLSLETRQFAFGSEVHVVRRFCARRGLTALEFEGLDTEAQSSYVSYKCLITPTNGLGGGTEPVRRSIVKSRGSQGGLVLGGYVVDGVRDANREARREMHS